MPAERGRIAERTRARRKVQGDRAGTAGAIVHHHLLAEPLGDFRTDQPCDRVVRAAGGGNGTTKRSGRFG